VNGAGFSGVLVKANELYEQGFERWAFHPGMLFNAAEKWWGKPGPRGEPHPGVDLCAFLNAAGEVVRLDEGARVPAAFGGRVVAIMDDFLGRTVVVEHQDGAGDRFCTFYAHTVPRADLRVGDPVAESEVIATIAGTAGSKSGIRPHLHLSLARVSGSIYYPELDWRRLGSSAALELVDPLPFFDLPHVVLQAVP
jgi:murein DD-endopeptidase MepM/ murein hydrolase activator NlpD